MVSLGQCHVACANGSVSSNDSKCLANLYKVTVSRCAVSFTPEIVEVGFCDDSFFVIRLIHVDQVNPINHPKVSSFLLYGVIFVCSYHLLVRWNWFPLCY